MKNTKLAVGILIGIGLLAIGLLFLNNYLEKRIKTGIEDNLKKAKVTFDKVDVKLLDRKAEVINPFAKLENKTLKVDTIKLNDIHIWNYITKKDIVVGNLQISKPVVKFYNFQKKSEDSTNSDKAKGSSKFKNKILIKNVNIRDGSFEIFEEDSTSHRLFANLKAITMEQVRVNAQTLKETIPFNYELILLNADSLFYDMDKQHELAIGDLEIDNNRVTIADLSINPKFSKEAFQKTINKEKDRYQLSIDTILLADLNWTMQNDSLKFQNPYTELKSANFKIYRDKTLPDDNSFKPMYSEMIRKMPILIQFDSIQIADSYLKYEENIRDDREAGMVEFSDLNMSISNFTNIGIRREDFPKIQVISNASFMKGAPLHIEWQFDVSSRSDQFQISGDMGRLSAAQMNEFFKAGMNIEASGEILNMYFNFYGNENQAQGEMRLEYKDFKVEVLRKDGKRKNKIISGLANLIVRNKALNNKANYKEISYQRDTTKSFWNYLWNLLKNGALKSFL
ncbi:hypothetical protein G3I01_02260 [Gramella sp. MT6]|uniref:hypothetical protein n=1 Tax=Gramella sp. MT6 TaxID=2705471 RepID=UPI001C605002|nr:hypothetical protein [Gramella sp. MT6]QYA24378.1 hypothetical protein G3I01_02260 [Gramella sp. MT6]